MSWLLSTPGEIKTLEVQNLKAVTPKFIHSFIHFQAFSTLAVTLS